MQSKKNIYISILFVSFHSSCSPKVYIFTESFISFCVSFLFGIQKHEYKWNKYDNQSMNGCIVTNRCRRLSLFLFVIQIDFFLVLGSLLLLFPVILCSDIFSINVSSSSFLTQTQNIFSITTLFISAQFHSI